MTVVSYICLLHYKCVKWRVLCLDLMTFDCKGHSFLWKGSEGFLWAWWVIMTSSSSSSWQLSLNLEWVQLWAFTHSDLSSLFVSLPNTWVLRLVFIFNLNSFVFCCVLIHLRQGLGCGACMHLCVYVEAKHCTKRASHETAWTVTRTRLNWCVLSLIDALKSRH